MNRHSHRALVERLRNPSMATCVDDRIAMAEAADALSGPDRSSALKEAAAECYKAARIYRGMKTIIKDDTTGEERPAEDAAEAEEMAYCSELNAKAILSLLNTAPQVTPEPKKSDSDTSRPAAAVSYQPVPTNPYDDDPAASFPEPAVAVPEAPAIWSEPRWNGREWYRVGSSTGAALSPQPSAGPDVARDAARYRWLRSRERTHYEISETCIDTDCPNDMDSAIDALMQRSFATDRSSP